MASFSYELATHFGLTKRLTGLLQVSLPEATQPALAVPVVTQLQPYFGRVQASLLYCLACYLPWGLDRHR